MADDLLDRAARRWQRRAATSTPSYEDGWTEGIAEAHEVSPDDVRRASDLTRQGENYRQAVSDPEKPAAWKEGYQNAFRSKKKSQD